MLLQPARPGSRGAAHGQPLFSSCCGGPGPARAVTWELPPAPPHTAESRDCGGEQRGHWLLASQAAGARVDLQPAGVVLGRPRCRAAQGEGGGGAHGPALGPRGMGVLPSAPRPGPPARLRAPGTQASCAGAPQPSVSPSQDRGLSVDPVTWPVAPQCPSSAAAAVSALPLPARSLCGTCGTSWLLCLRDEAVQASGPQVPRLPGEWDGLGPPGPCPFCPRPPAMAAWTAGRGEPGLFFPWWAGSGVAQPADTVLGSCQTLWVPGSC